MHTPYYRLKELIIEKYGEEKFDVGCELVARWLSFATKEKVNEGWLEVMCDRTDQPDMYFQFTGDQAHALKQLFKLNTFSELYTYPETTPSYYFKLKPQKTQ